MRIKEWADKEYEKHKETITGYIAEGIPASTAYHIVMDASILGAGYKAQMKRDFNLTIGTKY